MERLEVTNCDLKRARRAALFAFRFYGARRDHGSDGAQQSAGYPHERGSHTSLRATKGNAPLNAELSRKLDALESKYDAQFRVVFEAIRELMSEEEAPKRRIGFNQGEEA